MGKCCFIYLLFNYFFIIFFICLYNSLFMILFIYWAITNRHPFHESKTRLDEVASRKNDEPKLTP